MAKTPEKHLKISANLTPAQQVQINVVDTGVGLKPQDFETLYEPFTTDKMGGLGVGLSISRSIIANHDGHLWAEANPGAQAGASFCFTLPIVDA